jgi:hypothetical protein
VAAGGGCLAVARRRRLFDLLREHRPSAWSAIRRLSGR